MGIVANFAAFHADRRVLIHVRPSFFRVALDAGFLATLHLFNHRGPAGCSPGGGEGPMRIVAIATGHHALVDAVLERHGELRTNIGVALVAELRLHFRQQKFRRGRRMDGVATGAHYIVRGVGGAADVSASERLGVTAQAIVLDFFRLELGKSDDGSFSTVGRDVSFPRTVATLASSVFGRLLTGGHALEVRVLIKLRPDVGMAGLTGLAAYEAIR